MTKQHQHEKEKTPKIGESGMERIFNRRRHHRFGMAYLPQINRTRKMTANFNTIHIPPMNGQRLWQAGETFTVPKKSRLFVSWRVLIFDGLPIKSVGFNFGQMLYFDWNDWEEAKKNFRLPAPEKTKRSTGPTRPFFD